MFGIEIFDANGVKCLDQTYFTMRKIYETTIPSQTSPWTNGVRSDSIVLTVPDFVASECFVIITPLTYSGAQSESSDPYLTPYYRELGGNQIGIVCYQQVEWYNAAGAGTWVDRWRFRSVACTVEVFKVFGG